MKILFVGEINPDLILQGYESFPELGREVLVRDSSMMLGSASAICASAAATLGNEVSFFGKVGCDPWGDFCLDRMRSVGIDTSPVVRDPGLKTGITVSISGPTDRALVTHLGAIAQLTEADVPDSVFEDFRHMHLSTFFMQHGLRPGVSRLLERATRAGLTCSLDPGCDPSGAWNGGIHEAIRNADLFFPNEVELAGITGIADPENALRSLENPRTLVVAKLGAEGSMAIVDGQVLHVPAVKVDPVDTTGAGDSYNAGFLDYWLRGHSIKRCMQFGAVYGALSTLGLGGTGHHVPRAEAEGCCRQAFGNGNGGERPRSAAC